MMKNSEARSLSKRYFTANAPPTGTTAINKTPKNRYFTNACLHSFCFFLVASIASFMFKFCLFRILRFRANFSEIYAAKARVWASKRLNLNKNQLNSAENKFKPNQIGLNSRPNLSLAQMFDVSFCEEFVEVFADDALLF